MRRRPSSCAAAVVHSPSVFHPLLCHHIQVVAARAALPLPALSGSSLPDALSAHQDLPWKLLSSWREQEGSSCFAQSVVLRGMCQEKGTR